MKMSSETGNMMRPPLDVFALTADRTSGMGTDMRVSRVGEQNAHCLPQPRVISTMPYVDRRRGMTKFSMDGSGALTVGGRSRPSSAIWNTSRILDSARPLITQSIPSRWREAVLSICQAPAPPTMTLGLCLRIAGCRYTRSDSAALMGRAEDPKILEYTPVENAVPIGLCAPTPTATVRRPTKVSRSSG